MHVRNTRSDWYDDEMMAGYDVPTWLPDSNRREDIFGLPRTEHPELAQVCEVALPRITTGPYFKDCTRMI